MTTRKRNDASGHVRGSGGYSKSHPSLDRRDYLLGKVSKSIEGEVIANSDKKNGGYAAALDKK